jgi:hypothetical protein
MVNRETNSVISKPFAVQLANSHRRVLVSLRLVAARTCVRTIRFDGGTCDRLHCMNLKHVVTGPSYTKAISALC